MRERAGVRPAGVSTRMGNFAVPYLARVTRGVMESLRPPKALADAEGPTESTDMCVVNDIAAVNGRESGVDEERTTGTK